MKDREMQEALISRLLLQPVIFSLLTVGTYLFGKKPEFGLYAIAGTGLIGLWNNNVFTSGQIINRERRMGTLSLLFATPTPLPLILLGKSFATTLTSLIAVAVTFLTGMIAFKLPLGIQNPVAFLIGLLLITLALTCLGLVMSCLFVLTRNAGEFDTVANYPVYILSGLTFPLTMLPLWTRPLSAVLPTTWGNVVLNQAATQLGASMLPGYLCLIGLSLFYLAMAWFLFKRVEYLALRAGTLERW
jgi:ABC-2 type transport system permease protein